MKLSVSLPEDDVEFLDEYALAVGASSRSAVVQKAVRLLRSSQLGVAYSQAWEEWERSEDSEIWQSTCADGMAGVPDKVDDAPR